MVKALELYIVCQTVVAIAIIFVYYKLNRCNECQNCDPEERESPVDMPMPKTCADCGELISTGSGFCCILSTPPFHGISRDKYNKCRPDWCPIKGELEKTQS